MKLVDDIQSLIMSNRGCENVLNDIPKLISLLFGKSSMIEILDLEISRGDTIYHALINGKKHKLSFIYMKYQYNWAKNTNKMGHTEDGFYLVRELNNQQY